MKKYQINYGEQIRFINAFIEQYGCEKNYARNCIHFFRPQINKPLNIVGSFEKAIISENHSAPTLTSRSKQSFGMSSAINFGLIRQKMLSANSPFSDSEAFCGFVDQNKEWFCIDEDEYCDREAYNQAFEFEQYQKAFLARCLIASSFAFGFVFQYNGQDGFINCLKEHRNVILIEDKEQNRYAVRGRIGDDLICRFADVLLTVFDDKNSCSQIALKNLYSADHAEYVHCFSTDLYSGTIPRLCSVIYEKPEIGDQDVYKLLFEMGRTTFMTIYSFNFEGKNDGTDRVLKHPFMTKKEKGATYEEINRYFDLMEVRVQTEFYEIMSHSSEIENVFEDELATLNTYLQSSWNIHNVNISGNIITRENICIYVKRSSEMSDANHLFCSVNGGSEIYDSDVSYYKTSIPEAIPTIHYGTSPFYFGGELTKEAVAELGLSDNSEFWKYYGFTCMSGYKGKDSTHALWLHFNVLGEKYCSDSFEQIYIKRLNALEKKENSEIYGYELSVVGSRKQRFANLLNNTLSLVIDWKDAISIVIMCLIIGFGILKSLEFVIALAFSALIVINILSTHFVKPKYLKRIKSETVFTYKNNDYKKIFEKLFGKQSDIDMILSILTRMRIITMLESAEQLNRNAKD